MAVRFVLDTNALIYLLSRATSELPPAKGTWAVSIITEMEFRSGPRGDAQWSDANGFWNAIPVIPLDDSIKELAIGLRRGLRLKLPDAIIAASALATDAQLISNDAVFRRVPNLEVTTLAIGTPPSAP